MEGHQPTYTDQNKAFLVYLSSKPHFDMIRHPWLPYPSVCQVYYLPSTMTFPIMSLVQSPVERNLDLTLKSLIKAIQDPNDINHPLFKATIRQELHVLWPHIALKWNNVEWHMVNSHITKQVLVGMFRRNTSNLNAALANNRDIEAALLVRESIFLFVKEVLRYHEHRDSFWSSLNILQKETSHIVPPCLTGIAKDFLKLFVPHSLLKTSLEYRKLAIDHNSDSSSGQNSNNGSKEGSPQVPSVRFAQTHVASPSKKRKLGRTLELPFQSIQDVSGIDNLDKFLTEMEARDSSSDNVRTRHSAMSSLSDGENALHVFQDHSFPFIDMASPSFNQCFHISMSTLQPIPLETMKAICQHVRQQSSAIRTSAKVQLYFIVPDSIYHSPEAWIWEQMFYFYDDEGRCQTCSFEDLSTEDQQVLVGLEQYVIRFDVTKYL
jgi:hypothetical protein